ncbi:hypothetical protein IPH67_04845 [bacterium]|nr:MAG: hypothetical protein IPH67_04845 [bacterium]
MCFFLILSYATAASFIHLATIHSQSFDTVSKPYPYSRNRQVSKGFTTTEYQKLQNYLEQRVTEYEIKANHAKKHAYEECMTLLKKLKNSLPTAFIKENAHYDGQQVKKLIKQLETLDEDIQSVVDAVPLRISFLKGKLEKSWFLIKEILTIEWQFEYDDVHKNMIDPFSARWPQVEDKAWHVILLVEQLYRSYDKRCTQEEIETAVSILEEYLLSFEFQVSNIVTRAAVQARKKLENIRTIRGM